MLAEPVFRDVPAVRLIGLMKRYSMQSRSEIPQLWGQFVPHIGHVPQQVGHCTYGVSKQVSGNDDDFDYMAAVEVAGQVSVPEGLTEYTIAPHHFAVFTHTEHVSQLPHAIDWIYRNWLPASGRKAAPGPCVERYSEEFCGESGLGGIEIWVPIIPT